MMLCLIKHELMRLDYEGKLADVLCKQLIIEFSFPHYLNFSSFPFHAGGIISDSAVILRP